MPTAIRADRRPVPAPAARSPLDPERGPPIPTFEVADESEHRALARWRRNVGDPVALDLAPRAPAEVREIDLLSWNVAVGTAEVDRVLARLREAGVGADPARPLVALLQEAYRSDATVPEAPPEPRHTGGDVTPPRPRDVVALAREHGLSLRYAPSMRNGAHRSDRGNAILSTAALARTHAFALLYINQRRVAVAAELAGLPGVALVSAHLDTSRRWGAADTPSRVPGRARAEQAAELARAVLRVEAPADVVLGGDFNTPLGDRDPAYRALLRAGLRPAERAWRWDHTHHHLFRLPLDHVLYHPVRRVAAVRVERLDEHPLDRGMRVFGSDHHPLLARVELHREAAG